MARPHPLPHSPDSSWRYERKFEAGGIPLAQAELIVRLHPACFRVAFPTRSINNVYLDQVDLQSFRTHRDGASRRQKFRIRWYGEARGTIAKPILEVKRKRGIVGTKLAFPLAPFAYGPDFDFEPVRRDALARIDDPAVAEFIGGSRPALFNRYERRYLLSADKRFRLTIDSALRFESVGHRALGALSQFSETGVTVLELKYAVEDDGAAKQIAGKLPFRLGKCSKYLLGISRLSGLER